MLENNSIYTRVLILFIVPSANKKDLRSIEQTLNDMKSRKKPKLDPELSTDKSSSATYVA